MVSPKTHYFVHLLYQLDIYLKVMKLKKKYPTWIFELADVLGVCAKVCCLVPISENKIIPLMIKMFCDHISVSSLPSPAARHSPSCTPSLHSLL